MRTLRVPRVKTRDDVVWVVLLCCGVCLCVCVCVCACPCVSVRAPACACVRVTPPPPRPSHVLITVCN